MNQTETNSLKEKLTLLFLELVQITSQSDSGRADQGIMPSTDCQFKMAQVLKEKMTLLGLKDVQTTEWCYTYGFFPASTGCGDITPFCLLSHIDTSEETSGKNVKPLLHKNYDGSTIKLSDDAVIDSAKDKELLKCAGTGDTIITSSGDTLLGGDDKAGIAEILTAIQYLNEHPDIKHGPIEIIFSPDEETGHGMDKVPLHLLKSKYAYTVDGGNLGELETECFNAWKSEITFTGNACHTGTARGVMINAVTMASMFVNMLPRTQAPETTDGYQGFYAPLEISGTIESAKVNLLLRDFSLCGIERQKQTVDSIAKAVENSTGGKTCVKHTQQYLNMKEKISQSPHIVKELINAYNKADVKPVQTPIRGGTDGSRLTEMGIPCPNIFTGGHNFHSRTEWVSVNQMTKAVQVLINLIGKQDIKNV